MIPPPTQPLPPATGLLYHKRPSSRRIHTGKSELVCVPLHVNSFLRPGCKCLELTENSCHQRPYHIISASQTLTTYKCLLAPENGWIFVVNLSSISQSYLLTSKQYMAISSELRLYPTSMKNCWQQHSRGNLPKELLQNGDGVLVKYGAIVAAEQGPATSGRSSKRYIFIGEFSGMVAKFSRIQERVNLTNSLNKESVWPELPKHDNSTAGDICPELGDAEKCKLAATEGDGQAKSSKCLVGREPTIEAEDHLGTNEEPRRASNTALSELVPGQASMYGNVWNFNSQHLPTAAPGEPFYCNYHQMSYFDQKDHLE